MPYDTLYIYIYIYARFDFYWHCCRFNIICLVVCVLSWPFVDKQGNLWELDVVEYRRGEGDSSIELASYIGDGKVRQDDRDRDGDKERERGGGE